MDDKNLRAYMAELIGTFALVLVSAGAVVVNGMGGLQPATLSIALAAGLIYAAMLAVTLPQSGYLNPAVTITLWVFRRLDSGKTLALVGVQVLGALMAGLALRLMLPFREDVFNATRLGAPHLNLVQFGAEKFSLSVRLEGIAIELVLTFILVFTIFATLIDPRAPRWFGPSVQRLGALWVGLVVVVATIVAFPLTGAALNPARWLGPALAELTVESLRLQGPFDDNAAYWIGPIGGALLAGWAYTALILPPEEEEKTTGHRAGPAVAGMPANVTSTLFRTRK
jgi:aquaporin TIP